MKWQYTYLFVSVIFNFITISLQAEYPLAIANFDVREKFRDCYNEGYDTDYNEIPCTTNWSIQFSLILTDKNCILGNKGKRLISSMNINSCMKLKDKVQNCRDLSPFYKDFSSTTQVIDETIK
jgi:hypothetical protein